MPGVERLSIDLVVEAVTEAAELGIPVVALFPATDPTLKDPDGKEALNPENLVCRAVRAIKQSVPDIGIMCDVALDPYTSHGQDGLVRDGMWSTTNRSMSFAGRRSCKPMQDATLSPRRI